MMSVAHVLILSLTLKFEKLAQGEFRQKDDLRRLSSERLTFQDDAVA